MDYRIPFKETHRPILWLLHRKQRHEGTKDGFWENVLPSKYSPARYFGYVENMTLSCCYSYTWLLLLRAGIGHCFSSYQVDICLSLSCWRTLTEPKACWIFPLFVRKVVLKKATLQKKERLKVKPALPKTTDLPELPLSLISDFKACVSSSGGLSGKKKKDGGSNRWVTKTEWATQLMFSFESGQRATCILPTCCIYTSM